jgi:hypothetical protein
MPGDHVFRRPSGTRTGPFTARRVDGGLAGPGGEFDEIEIGDVQGLQTALDGKAASSHTHAISAVTGLQAALDSKAGNTHTHTPASLGAAEVGSSQWPGLIRLISGGTAWHVTASIVCATPVSFLGSGGEAVLLTWLLNGNTSVDIYRSETNDWATAVLLTNVSGESHEDTTALAGTTYYYWLVGRIGPAFSEPTIAVSAAIDP